jgi:hypothetical protein
MDELKLDEEQEGNYEKINKKTGWRASASRLHLIANNRPIAKAKNQPCPTSLMKDSQFGNSARVPFHSKYVVSMYSEAFITTRKTILQVI